MAATTLVWLRSALATTVSNGPPALTQYPAFNDELNESAKRVYPPAGPVPTESPPRIE